MSRSYAAYVEILDTRGRGPLVPHPGQVLCMSRMGAAYAGPYAGRLRTGCAGKYDSSRGSSFRDTANNHSHFDDMSRRQYPGGSAMCALSELFGRSTTEELRAFRAYTHGSTPAGLRPDFVMTFT